MRLTLAGLASTLVLSGALSAQDRPLPRADPAAVGLDQALLTRADSIAEASLPALQSLLVVRRGRLAFERYYHGASAATPINIKSVTKSIQGATVGIAHGEGLIPSLDQPVAEILPDAYARPLPTYPEFALAIRQSDQARRKVTIRHLLTMTTGIGWEESGLVLNAFLVSPNPVQFVAELPMAAPPGTGFNYSTAATHLLSAVVARKVGRSASSYTEEKLLRPAGIDLIRWDSDPQGIHFGGAEMLLTSLGMARFGQLFLDNGTIDGTQVVPAEWVAASWEQRVSVETPIYRSMIPGLDGYGYLWWRRVVDGVVWQCALGYGGQFVLIAPALQLVVAGGSALDQRNPGMIEQFRGIFHLVDSLIQPAARPG